MDLLIHFENDFDLAPVCFGIVPVTKLGSGSAVRVLFLLSCFVSSGLLPLGGLFLFSFLSSLSSKGTEVWEVGTISQV